VVISRFTAPIVTHCTVCAILNDPLPPLQWDELRQKAVRSCRVDLRKVVIHTNGQPKYGGGMGQTDRRTIIVAAFTSERPSSLGTFKSCSSRKFATLLQVPTWLAFMTTQSPRWRPLTPSPTFVTSASPSFPPTNTSPRTPGKLEGCGFEG
jgi:hypothetical protein